MFKGDAFYVKNRKKEKRRTLIANEKTGFMESWNCK